MSVRILEGDCRASLATLPDRSVQMCVTSPPYFGLRDYGHAGQIGLEPTPEAYVAQLVQVFREVRRVLRDDGTLWLNLGDSYASIGRSARKESPGVGATQEMKAVARTIVWEAGGGHNFSWAIPSFGTLIKPKDLLGIPWRVAFALQSDGWYLRSDIIWHKPNPMPESVTDRPTKSHEYLFLLAKSERYYYDAEAVKESSTGRDAGNGFDRPHRLSVGPGDPTAWVAAADGKRNRRSVWTVSTSPFKGAHFATFPPALVEPCILAGSKRGDVVLDPFGGAGTTGLVADRLGRDSVLCELNPAYADMARKRIGDDNPLFTGDAA